MKKKTPVPTGAAAHAGQLPLASSSPAVRVKGGLGPTGLLVASESGRVWLVNMRTGRTRGLGDGEAVAVSGGRIVVHNRDGDGGISVLDLTGRFRFGALAGRQVGELQVFGGYAYGAGRIVSLRAGRVVGRAPRAPTLLLPSFR